MVVSQDRNLHFQQGLCQSDLHLAKIYLLLKQLKYYLNNLSFYVTFRKDCQFNWKYFAKSLLGNAIQPNL